MLGVEATERAEQVGPHERGRARDVEDVADRVVLLLVELAPLDVRGRCPGLVGAHADLEDAARDRPSSTSFGADDAGVRAERLLDHHLDRVGVEPDVVVAEQVEGRSLDRRQHLVGGRAEARRWRRAGARGRRGRSRRRVGRGRRCWPPSITSSDVLRVGLGGDAGAASPRTTRPGSWATMTTTTGGTTASTCTDGGPKGSSGGCDRRPPDRSWGPTAGWGWGWSGASTTAAG